MKKKLSISGMSKDLSKSISEDIKKEVKKSESFLERASVGISVSDSEEFEELGFSETHQKDVTIEITRYLLVNGAHLIYGGDLRQGGYTYAFSELSFQYRIKEEQEKKHFTNYFGWPIYNQLKNSDEAEFKKNRVEIIKIDAPIEVPDKFRDQYIFPDNIENRVWWASSMSKTREEMVKKTNARIFIGGKLTDYKGFYPGIIEEAYLSLKAKQPIYLIGAFGGASKIVIRALKGENYKMIAKEIIDNYPKLNELYNHVGQKEAIQKLETMIAEFGKLGVSGLCKLNNLNKEQNEKLFNTNHFHEMIYNMLLGLRKCF